jgi:peptidyl-prolyl cis-trans isomerase C
MMKLRTFAAILLAVPAIAAAQEAAKPAAKAAAKPAARGPVATVNGVAIPAARQDFMVQQQRTRGAPDNEQTRNAVREDLITREVVVQEATRAGIAKQPDVQVQMDIARQDVLVNAYLRDWVQKHPATELEMQQEYDRARAQAGDKEYRARHILVDNEDQAKQILADLKKGAKFDDLAAKNSKDPGSKDRGGDLDWQVPAAFDKAFSDAMVKLEKGRMTDVPVRTRFGYHIILLEDVRQTRFPTYAEVKPRIQQQMMQNKVDEMLRGLRAKAKVE